MRTRIQAILAALGVLVLCGCLRLNAQTNPVTPPNNTAGPVQPSLIGPSLMGGLSEIASAMGSATNWYAGGGYGRGLTGNKSVAFADVAYNFNENVGVVVGMDTLWGGAAGQTEIVKGGVTLSLPGHPLAFTGISYLAAVQGRAFVSDLLATPKNGNTLGNLIVTGYEFDLYTVSNFELYLAVMYENRSGQGYWDGNYAMIQGGISRRF